MGGVVILQTTLKYVWQYGDVSRLITIMTHIMHLTVHGIQGPLIHGRQIAILTTFVMMLGEMPPPARITIRIITRTMSAMTHGVIESHVTYGEELLRRGRALLLKGVGA